ncbi:LysR family transcriptional regulator [Photobacterium sp. CCB-ST2H9]|uniref:LysR family transcriptional regulator n=1 Tax=Photobacterium sp. CCB-ST2H9 TaxID=2912855 RepID=UPI00200313A3|nr:LysR family transcriptional regulator [Photobacterium sp. CCB-ST2H9]UTM59338.1 LysR family transcriptional regulator [Photobacterium sp. CCB-ST2H9]
MESGVDLNLLRTLVIVCESKNLKLAAVRLGVTESAVSKQLSRLSEQLNEVLFERTPNGLEPTAYTRLLLPDIQSALKSIQTALNKKTFDPRQFQGTLTIALPLITLDKFGKQLFQTLKQALPQSKIILSTWNSTTLSSIINGEIIMGVHFWNSDIPGEIHLRNITDDEFVVAIAKSHAASDFNEVKTWPFIMLRSSGWNDHHSPYYEKFVNLGTTFNFEYQLDSPQLAYQFMSKEKVAMLMTLKNMPDDLKRIPTPDASRLQVKLSSYTTLANRSNPLNLFLHKKLVEVFSSKSKGPASHR